MLLFGHLGAKYHPSKSGQALPPMVIHVAPLPGDIFSAILPPTLEPQPPKESKRAIILFTTPAIHINMCIIAHCSVNRNVMSIRILLYGIGLFPTFTFTALMPLNLFSLL